MAAARRETELERYDRNPNELMGELRVALPGVQVLFAFLLVAPFNQRFGTVSDFERALYLATLLCTLLATVLLIAPAASPVAGRANTADAAERGPITCISYGGSCLAKPEAATSSTP